MGNLLTGEGRSHFHKMVRGVNYNIDLWLKGISVIEGHAEKLVHELRDFVPPLALKVSQETFEAFFYCLHVEYEMCWFSSQRQNNKEESLEILLIPSSSFSGK